MTPLPWLALAEEWSGSAPHPPQLNARASDRGDIKKKEGRKEEGEFGEEEEEEDADDGRW